MKKKSLIVIVLLVVTLMTGAKTRERLVFDLRFGVVKGGEAVMTIKDTTFAGKDALHYYLKGHTTGLTDKLFKVNDVYESTIDATTFLPYRAVRNIRERNYRYYNEVFFYHDIDSIYSQKTGWMKVPDNLSDFLTVFFYVAKNGMTEKIAGGKTVELPTIHGHQVSNIKIKFSGIEKVETRMGPVECYVLSPVVEKGKVLRRSDGLKFYIAKETKVPIQLDFETKAGTLRAVLVSYKINGKEQIKK